MSRSARRIQRADRSAPVGRVAVSEYGDFSDQQVKHLEMIQAVVARLSNSGFFVKGWAITVTAALLAIAVDQDQWDLAAAAAAPTVLFWILDASFLRSERLFRHLFSRVASGQEAPFFMGATSEPYVARVRAEAKRGEAANDASSRLKTFGRLTLVLFYGAVLLACAVVALIICRA